jgi:hypothetical protein
MKIKHHNKLSGKPFLMIITLNIILLFAFSEKENIFSRNIEKNSIQADSDPLQQEKNARPGLTDEIVNIDGIRKHLQSNIRYPADEAHAGHTGTVELYASVTREGWIEEVLERPPSANYIEIKDTIVMSIRGMFEPKSESSKHARLIKEGHRSLMSLPRLDIPEIQGGVIKVIFRWQLLWDDL